MDTSDDVKVRCLTMFLLFCGRTLTDFVNAGVVCFRCRRGVLVFFLIRMNVLRSID